MPETPIIDDEGVLEPATLSLRVAAWAGASPDAVALVHGARHLTYRELHRRTRRLAARLAADGVVPEERVGVAVGRSPETVVSLLAVQEAGGAFLPLDPSYPEERLAFMAADAGVRRLLCDAAAAELPFAAALRRLDPGDLSGDLSCDGAAGGGGAAAETGALAYVIYTSGSTGKPKGVMVPHDGLANLVEAELEVFGTGPDDRVLQFAPTSFDASVFEIAMALGAGAALVLAGREELLPGPGLARLLARERITRVTLPPSVLAALPEEVLPDLGTLISAGEALPAELVARWGAGRRMWNAFGPTETTVWATVGRCRRGEPRPPIGGAIPGLSVHLVDARLAPVAVGDPGEIAVGGVGVARGYLDRPGLTAERFVPDPFPPATPRSPSRPQWGKGTPPPEPLPSNGGTRLYRTGDLGRRLPDGRIEYLGRADHQVKVRGHRVEPGEVEAVLGRHPAVRACAVVAERDPVDPHGGYRLAAFVVLGEEWSAAALSDHLAGRLPPHLVPARIARLDELPLLPNGKIDRAALLALDDPAGAKAPRARRAPATATETALAAVWQELLGVDDPSLDDDLFELGGHSILVGRLISRVRRALGVELTARAVFEARTLGAMAAAVDSAAEPPLPPIERAPRDRPLPLTFPQERIWFLEELSPDNLAYNAQVCIHFAGSLDVRALARSLAEVVRRHEVYRSRFFAVDGTPYQEPLDPAACPVPLPVIDLSALPARRRDAERERRTREEIARPFDLARPPLGRWTLFREEGGREALLQVEHHLAHDGWSFAVLLAELRRLYEAFSAGRPSPLPEVPVQVGDYALWQRRLMSGERLRRTLDYWRGRLAGAPPVLALPTDRPRPPVQSFRGDAVRFDLDPELADGLRRLARNCGGTLFGVMRAGFDTLLSRYTGEDDLVVGSGAANRRTEGSEAMIGMVVNTLPVRVELSGAPGFREVVARVGEALVGAHAHEDVPFDRLVDALGVARDASRNPLVQVLFSFHDSPVPDLRFPGLAGRIAEQHNRTAKTDLNVVVIPRAEQRVGMMGVDRPAEPRDAAETAVTVIWEYATDLFDRSSMERMTRHYRALLAAAVAAPAARAVELEILSPAERRQLLAEWRGSVGDYPSDSSLADLFAARAAERPDAEALVTAGEGERRAVSYGALAATADRLARRLRRSGVRRGDRVALALDRSFEAVVAMIAVLRAGGAYVPLDPSYPAERLRFMLEDSGVSRIVTREEALALAPALAESGLPVVRVESADDGGAEGGEALREPVGGGDLAYVVYTSGSTGRPKGVAVPHRAVARLVLETGYTPFGPDQTFLHAASVSFDAATYEVWGALLHGARLAVLPPGPQTPDRLAEAMARERPTALFLTTGLFNQLAEDRIDAFAPLAHLMTGGEAASPDAFRRVLAAHPGLTVSNVYGPTENTTFSTHHPMTRPAEVGEPVPIGGAIGHTTVLVADRGLRPVPVGVVGELLVGGDGLAWGYHGRPALTAERFPPSPCPERPGERMYRTGDLVRRSGRTDLAGAIEFVGRNDSQVKVRGFRIEPGEVELALEAHPEVSEAMVLARDLRGEKALVGYVVPSSGAGDGAGGELAKRLRAHLAHRLPAHAVPQAIVTVPRFPLTVNGKVDRSALPDPETATAAAVGSVPPRGPVEEMVAAVWSEVLEQSPIGAHDDFFHLGGHSLAATRVVSRLRRMTGLALPLVELFESPTVAGLARAIRSLGRVAGTEAGRAGDGVPVLGPAPGGPRTAPYSAPASFAQERLWFLDRFEREGAVYNVPASVRLRGRLAPAHLRRALHGIERRHEGLRTVFSEERPAGVAPAGGAPGLVAPAGVAPERLAAAVRQTIRPPSFPPLPVIDLSGLVPARRAPELARAARDDARRRFDLARGPLWRARLVRLADDEHALLLTLHHVITDGWSMTLLYRDLWKLYEAAEAGRAADLPEPAVRYADFARWQREWLRGPVLAAEVDGWRERLAGAPPVLPLPLDRPRPAARSGRGGRVTALLPPVVLEALRTCARAHDASLFMVLLAALQAWLARATGEDDVPVGTPVANRGQAETEEIVGFFVNTLVLRTDLAGDPTFAELLERVRGVALAAFAHQELPFEKLVEALAPARDTAVTPLYQVSLALQNAGREVPGPPGIEVSRLPVEIPVAKLDLSLSFTETVDGLELRVSYDRDLLDRTTVLRTVAQLRALLSNAVLCPQTRLSALPVVTAAERRALLEAAEAPPARLGGELAAGGSFLAAFRGWAERTPEAVALEEGDARWSYRALDRRASALAAHLRVSGVGPESRVALLLETSAEAIVALLAVHAAGGAFVPLDPAQPEERLRFQVADSGAAVVLAGGGFDAAGIAGAAAVVRVDLAAGERTAEAPAADGGHLAYVSYTSGSTGRPKGVAVENRQLLSYVAAIVERLEIGPGDALATLSSLAADLGHTAVFPALASGGRLVVLPRATATDPAAMAAAARRHRYDLLKIVPSHLAALLSATAPPEDLLPARWLVLGGEALPRELAERLLAAGGPRVVNHYGPTETTVGVLTRPVRADRPTVPLGRPLPGRSVHVLDAHLAPVPAGVAGEIVVGGEGVARGYLGRPALTAERFLPDPFSGREGARLYRTGDRGRRLPDGEIEFLGRVDDQVKVRGFRVELGEVEAALRRLPGVREAAATLVAGAGSEAALTAFVVPAPEAPLDAASLRAALARSLPDAMVPARVVAVDRLPRLPNGKIDRRALAQRALSGAAGEPAAAPAPGPAPAPPATPLEELVALAWGEVLGTGPVPASGADFFALGGHSLLAIRAVARLHELTGVEVPLRQLFDTPTVAGLARWIGDRIAGGGADAGPIPRLSSLDLEAGAPASFAQERLWFLDRLGTDRRSYGVPTVLAVDGPLRPAALARALGGVARRHEPLRTNLVASDEAEDEVKDAVAHEAAAHVVQVVRPAAAEALPVVDLSGLPEAPRAAERGVLLAAESTRPFDLAADPPLRAALLREAPEAHLLLVVVHHVAFDAWSRPLFLRELATLYENGGDAAALPALPIRYRDYAAWQRRALGGERLDALVARARERLAGAPRRLDLPADRPRPAVRSERGASVRRALAPELSDGLRRLARDHGASLFMTLLAGFEAHLSRLTGAGDLLLGTPIAGRSRPETGPLIGLFVDTLVLRAGLGGDPAFERVLSRARADALAAFAGADLPFERLVEALEPERDLSHAPLFQVGFGFEGRAAAVPPPSGLSWRPAEVPRTTAKLDLALVAREEGDRLVLQADHSADLFDATTVARWLRQVETLLGAAVEAPATRLSELPLSTPAERHQALREWADGGPAAGAADRTETLHAGFAAQVARTPDAIAVTAGSVRWSYRELERRAEAVARRLNALGVGPEVPVGVALDRTPWLVAALLGVLRAGGAYVALDPTYPEARLAAVLAGCGTDGSGREPWIVTSAAVEARLPGALGDGRRVRVDDLDVPGDGLRIDGRAGSRNLAYVLFTSGSTGRPKGVAIEHRSAAAFLAWAARAFGADELAGTLASTSIAFDLSVFELFAPLGRGGTIHLAADALSLADPVRFPDAPRITLVNTVPSAAAELVRLGALPPSVRTLALAGEALPRSLAEAARAGRSGAGDGGLRVLDLYGPSEDTTYSTWGAVVPGERREPTIGRPVDGTRAYVLDAHLLPVPPGAVGELCLAGAGLARGYRLRPAETAASFVPDGFAAGGGGRLYRTGDLVRHLPDGRLDFLGRRDHQVKLRGFRIELGEIEAALCEVSGAPEAVAVVVGSEDPRLIAYVGAGGAPPAVEVPVEATVLRERLARRLPAYMVPSAIVVLPALPRTPNGKIDRGALPAPAGPESRNGGEGPPRPLTPTEELLVPVWESVLGAALGGVDSGRVGRDADFFALGGHSLLATRLLAAVRRTFEVELPLAAVFEAPTLAALARRIDAAARGEAAGAVPPPVTRASDEERAGPLPLSPAQRRLWFLYRLEERRLGSAYHVTQAVRLEGRLCPGVLGRALAEIVRRHEALRTRIVESADGEARQEIDPPPRAGRILSTTDFEAVPEANRQAALARWIAAETEQPFALGAEPPVRFRLARLGPVEHVLLVVAHHVAVDLGSFAVLYRELSMLYRAFAAGEPSPLPPPPLQYADWTVWQRRLARPDGEGTSVLAAQLAWWRDRLTGAPAVLELPTDRPRPAEQSYRGARVETALDPATAERLGAFCRQTGATPFMALLAAFAALLGRAAGRDELVIGSPVAGRGGEELDGAVGLFGNLLALRLDLATDGGPGGGRTPGLAELARRVRSRALAAYARQDAPFEQVVDALEIERDLSRPPLVQVTFSVQDPPLAELSLPGLAVRPLPSCRRSVQHDLAVQVAGAAGPEPRVALDYAADLYDEATTRALAERFLRLLAAGLAEPEAPVDALPWLSEAEERALVAAGTGPLTARESTASTLHGRVAARAMLHSERPAVGYGGEVVRYGELVAAARRLGHRLRAVGVGPEAPVGVLLERTPAMVAALLGVLEAGGSYLPLDPGHPPERIAGTLADAGARVLVTDEALAALVDPPGVRRVVIDGADREAIAAAPTAPVGTPGAASSRAYVIYTSGSTGKPKGVEVSHASVLAFLDAMARAPGLGPDDVALATTTIAFDISILEIFLPLVVGAQVELVDRETAADGAALAERLRGVTVAQATPTAWRMLLDAGWTATASAGSAPKALSGGEPLDRELAGRLLRALGGEGELWNVYGPTETTVWSSAGRVTAEALAAGAAGSVPIGEPIAGTRLYVVDPRGELCPPGVPGELRIGGAGVARGYRGRPALTAERFTPDPFAPDGAPGTRAYRTGDLARWQGADGSWILECLGRVDQQVKIRGHRIEPGEIEAALTARDDVSRAVVAPFPRSASSGARRLAAWLVLEPGRPEPTVEDLRGRLEEVLPPYMVPAAFVVLPELPRTPNGKIDRKALPEPDGLRLAADAPYVEPSSAAERALAAIWREVLGVERVGTGDSFFHLGGDSILALQVAARAAQAGWSLAVRDFFRHATLGELAAVLRRAAGDPSQALEAMEAPLPDTLDFRQAGLSEEELGDLLDEIG